MTLRFPPTSRALMTLLAAAIGIASGLLASRISMPLPWMLGPMLGCCLAAIMGAPVFGPNSLRPAVIPVIGVMLGSGFHPGLLGHASEWTGTLLLLPAFLVTATATGFAFYRYVGGYKPVDAFFCAAPGGLNEMIILGTAAGGDETRIALAHALRVFLVVSAVVFSFALGLNIRSAGGPGAWIGLSDLTLFDYAVLTASGLAGVVLGRRLRLPAPQLFGPMVLSAAAHMTEVITVPPPTIFVVASQITIGTILGCRFVGLDARRMRRDMALGFGATLVLLCVTLLFAALLGPLTGTPLSQGVLAFSPGGLTEMSLLALTMGQDVAYVSTMHVARIVLVILGMSLVFRWIGHRLVATETRSTER
ncbi:AbrB family transcriptional regulator [Tropicimonas sp. IMCC34043]|uniref:AbrB family transcriptional regulator n=1 Tax=Tropicimonas sp. IMCC34043 TaxID=2248760 RepID=UPI001E455988|nr:AbrB family transcriptional regulator [Tropicimonas sp. IMCC34043]